MATAFMFKGPAALTGASTAVTLTLSSGGNAVTSVSTTAATTGSNNLILATEAFVLTHSSSGSVVSITGTGATTLAANTSYFILASAAISANLTMPSGGSALADGSIIRFFAEGATPTNTITLAAGGFSFNVAGASPANLVLDTNGQSLQFMVRTGSLWLIGGGFTSSS